MNLRKFLFVLSLSLTILHLSALAQRDSIPLTTIIEKTSKLTNDHPTEKIYIHFDKPYYAVGDTIWFKAYATIDLHQPTQLSKIAYLDMTSSDNTLVSELKLHLANGIASGYLPLPVPNFKRGNYHIRAYTRWMRNADQAYFFNRTLTIGSIDDGQIVTHIFFKNSITEKVSKINAVIAYKDQDGNPYSNKKVNWKVVNDDGTINKGKGETDANGQLNINFTSNKPAELNSATISTEIDIDDKKTTNNTFPLETTPPGIDVQFFPEGGTLINGIRSRVAIKAVKPDGLGIDAKGTITDDAGKVVADFASQHLGMGVFAILPETGKTYKANLTFADGTQSSYDLPNIRSEGINMSLNNSNTDTLSIKIAANDGFFQKNQNKSFYVIAQSGGIVCYAAQTVLKSSVYSAAIPKSKFPTGIVQVTVFSSKGSPLSERIAFIQHNDQLSLTLKSDKPLYNRRQKVRMLISAKNKGLPSEGNFSVSVVDETTVPFDEDADNTILSHLLLTSDLKGYVEKPNYYFIHHDDKTHSDLDVLMLTQGYRRFTYKNVIADKTPPTTFLPEQGIDISGILRTNTGIPVAKGNIRLLIPDKNFSTQTTTDMSGNFRFSNVLVSDSSKVTLNARDNTNSNNLVINVDGVLAPPSTQYINPVGAIANIDSTLKPYLQNAKKQFSSRNLKEVVIKSASAIKKPSHEDYATLRLLSPDPDHTIPGERFKDCNQFVSCLIAASLGLTSENNNLYVTRDYNKGNRTPVQVYIDGLAVEYNYLNSVNANMVESVEIFYNDGLSGINRSTGTNGILVVNMKKQPKGEKISKDQFLDMLPKFNVVEYIPGGYNTTREFYSPRYDNPSSSTVGVDRRSTIYWNPNVITDKTGNTALEFFNADGTGSYRAIIEGIDKDGNIGRYVYRYKVQ
ncbi:MAG TPA: Ig-like domain-containing protein [Mucilaginibacter sp.]|nr:Ig-like domain-containing protein [Mucilaginibacter sp.]